MKSSQKNKEVIQQFYAGLNHNDVSAVMMLLDPHVVRREFEGELPNAGTFRGHAELKENFKQGRESWAEGSCKPVEFFENENKIIVKAHVHVRVKDHTDWIDAHVYDGFAVQDGLVTEFHSFLAQEKAFQWAGINAE